MAGSDGSPVTVLVKEKPIARFHDEFTLEAALCGSIRRQMMEDPGAVLEGAKCRPGNRTMMVDLKSAAGVEEAIRLLLNAYISSQSPANQDWWLSDEHLDEDPTCEKLDELRKKRGG